MRIATSDTYLQATQSIDSQQAQISKLQSEMSSGLRVQVASDDPVATGQIMSVDQSISDNQLWQANATTLTNRLGLEDTALTNVNSALQQIQTLALQANNSTLSASDRQSIATSMQSQLNDIMEQANAQDSTGRYLFAGTNDASAPFAQSSSGVTYSGNSDFLSLPVGPSRELAAADPGDAVFMDVEPSSGALSVTAATSNTGTAALSSASVTDPSQWTGASYTLSFNGGDYQVVDGSGNSVASGTYTSGQAIQFKGVSLDITGAPADGDSFSIGPSAPQSLFSTVQNLISQVAAAPTTPAATAQNQTQIFGSLQALEGVQNHVLGTLAAVGTREKAASDATTQLQARSTQLQTTLSGLQDLDFAAATTQLSQSQTTLQAAMQTYSQIQGLSLFNYLK